MAGAPASMALQTFKAEFFKALAHPIRIRILEVLRGQERSVQELQAALDLEQPIVSAQLALLRAFDMWWRPARSAPPYATPCGIRWSASSSTSRERSSIATSWARRACCASSARRRAGPRGADPCSVSSGRSCAAASSPSPWPATPRSSAWGRGSAGEIHRLFGRSLAIRQVDAGSCNGCELEIAGADRPALRPRALRPALRRLAAPRRLPARHGSGHPEHGRSAATHLGGHARPQARHRGRRLRA